MLVFERVYALKVCVYVCVCVCVCVACGGVYVLGVRVGVGVLHCTWGRGGLYALKVRVYMCGSGWGH